MEDITMKNKIVLALLCSFTLTVSAVGSVAVISADMREPGQEMSLPDGSQNGPTGEMPEGMPDIPTGEMPEGMPDKRSDGRDA